MLEELNKLAISLSKLGFFFDAIKIKKLSQEDQPESQKINRATGFLGTELELDAWGLSELKELLTHVENETFSGDFNAAVHVIKNRSDHRAGLLDTLNSSL